MVPNLFVRYNFYYAIFMDILLCICSVSFPKGRAQVLKRHASEKNVLRKAPPMGAQQHSQFTFFLSAVLLWS